MSHRPLALCVAAVLAAVPMFAANAPERPTLTAVRASVSPAVDGDLSDAAWAAAPEFTDFTQHDPDDGKPATLPTSVRIVYDDEAIYFGMKMTDPNPPTSLLARRDSFTQSDFVSINIDPQHDRLSGSAFTISPAGTQVDSILWNDINEDTSWDGVWQSATKVVPDGWVAEIRIPYSQLRFPDRDEHVWGLNITRRTVRLNEWVRIVNTPKGQTGFVANFADIVGINGIRRGRPFEIVPYAVFRSDILSRADRRNPLLDSREHRFDGGFDFKYALTSSMTLTGTVNPDFGQVEVDPAVVNLGVFETFYPEKRPFFTEGLNLFRFGDSPAPSRFGFIFSPSLFYSRRIGRSPQLSPDADWAEGPDETTILGAAKITGSLGKGWSMGVLDAITDSEHALFVNEREDGTFEPSDRQQVEPMTNYLVSRFTKEIGSRSRVGFMFNSVNRRVDEETSALRESAVTAGVDGYRRLGADKSWILEGSAIGTRVSGSETAMTITQLSPARYYDRPDAGHVAFDPTRTSLDGWGGRTMISKAQGLWRPIVQVEAYSPGFESNDVGRMQRTDIISANAVMQYVHQEPSKAFRSHRLWFGSWQNRNFDGDTLERGFFADAGAQFHNYWEASIAAFVMPGAFSDRETRGGPVVRTPASWSTDIGFNSDERKPFSVEVYSNLQGDEDGYWSRSVTLGLNFRPRTNLQVSLEPYLSRSHQPTQYVTQFEDEAAGQTYGRRYLFGNLDQQTFELGTRLDWTLTSTLSVQLYAQPFIASGEYDRFKSLDTPRTRDYSPYAGSIEPPDFNFRSLRGSAVGRWEFRPGSALYVVWNQNRADVVNVGDFRFGRDIRSIPNAPSRDVFLVKVSYFLPI